MKSLITDPSSPLFTVSILSQCSGEGIHVLRVEPAAETAGIHLITVQDPKIQLILQTTYNRK
jgi:hypothetical protein